MDFYEKALIRLGWIEITLWYSLEGGILFNHLEYGHNKTQSPTGTNIQQRFWKGRKWSKQLVYALRDTNPLQLI